MTYVGAGFSISRGGEGVERANWPIFMLTRLVHLNQSSCKALSLVGEDHMEVMAAGSQPSSCSTTVCFLAPLL